MRTSIRLGAAALLSSLAACAAPGAAAPNPVSTVEALPQQLGAFQRVGPATNYERPPGGAGLGASVRYVPANGERMVVTIYVYDRGRPRRPEGAVSPDVEAELQTAFGEVRALVQAGRYASATPGSAISVGQPSDPASARCLTFRVVQSDNTPTGDGVCVSVRGGRFLKVRATVWNPPEPNAAGLVAAGLLTEVQRAQGGAAPR